MNLEGGCQCGAVRYAATLTSDAAYYCHCRMCQKAFGNVRAAYVHLPKANVAWTRGAPKYYASSKIARRGFCGECGTPLVFEYLDFDKLDLSAGSFDDPGKLVPKMHVGVEGRVASFHVPDGLPEKRIDEFSHIVERWKKAYGPQAEPGKPR
jgi:hypothetical protein